MRHRRRGARRTGRIPVLALLPLLLVPPEALAEPEGFNRAMLRFNQWFFDHALEPAGRGYNVVVPKWGQRRMQEFFTNLEAPRDIVNSLLQWKPRRAGIHTGRFLVNTTIGIVGLFDVAGRHFDLTASPETLDETFGVWGLPPGSYLVMPVLGQFCVRSFVGYVGDGFMYPLGYIPGAPFLAVTAGAYVVRNVNLVAQAMPSPWAPEGQWEAYRLSPFRFDPYEVGRDLFFRDEADRIAD
jgi:ABC-type transporter lipoprotein component MlaA